MHEIHERLHPVRGYLLATALSGLAVSLAIIFFSSTPAVGFALAGPLVILPWCLMCVAVARPNSPWMPHWLYAWTVAFYLCGAALGISWPVIVLFS